MVQPQSGEPRGILCGANDHLAKNARVEAILACTAGAGRWSWQQRAGEIRHLPIDGGHQDVHCGGRVSVPLSRPVLHIAARHCAERTRQRRAARVDDTVPDRQRGK